MNPWVYAAAAAGVLAVVLTCLLVARSGRRSRAELHQQLVTARQDVLALTDRLEALSAEVDEARRVAEERAARTELEPFVITGVVAEDDDTTPREAQLVQAIEAGRPEWVPAKPLRQALVKSVSLAHGVRRALSPENRDRMRLEMQAEVRRSRRQRKAEMKAVRRFLRQQRKTAA